MSFHLSSASGLTDVEAADFGDVFAEAVALAQREGRASVWMLQCSLGLSSCRAARVFDALERLALVPPEIKPRPRAGALRPLTC